MKGGKRKRPRFRRILLWGASAVALSGLAALLSGRFPARGATIAIVLSGGNVDPQTFAAAIAAPEDG